MFQVLNLLYGLIYQFVHVFFLRSLLFREGLQLIFPLVFMLLSGFFEGIAKKFVVIL